MPTVIINGKKHTPSSGTLRKMKARAAAEAAMAKSKASAKAMAKPKASAKAMAKPKTKAPAPATMSDNLRNSRAAVAKPKTKAPVPATMLDDYSRAAVAAWSPKWSSGSLATTSAKKYATPHVNPKTKAPISVKEWIEGIKNKRTAPAPVKMPEGIKNKRTNTMFTRGKMDPTGGL